MRITSAMIAKRIDYEIRKKIAVSLRIMRRIILTGRKKTVENAQGSRIPWQNFAIILIFFLGCVQAFGCSSVAWPCAEPISDAQAIRIIVGEAANQGFTGMVAVGEVIRKNGDIKAFKGLNAQHSAEESSKTWMKASRAWQASANTNITHGANHFDNVEEFGEPYWAPDCITTAIIGQQYFFKC